MLFDQQHSALIRGDQQLPGSCLIQYVAVFIRFIDFEAMVTVLDQADAQSTFIQKKYQPCKQSGFTSTAESGET